MQDTIATITIDRLRLHCNHGVLEQERLVGNEFDVTVVFDYDASKAVLSDNIFSAISYTEVIDAMVSCMSGYLRRLPFFTFLLLSLPFGRAELGNGLLMGLPVCGSISTKSNCLRSRLACATCTLTLSPRR